MKWIHDYQLFLFDFDGILVNTEELHFKAYQKMCKDRGFSLNWDEKTYAKYALFSSTALKEAIYKEFPDLHHLEPNWDILYNEKKNAYFSLLSQGVSLMPGVKELLEELKKADIKRCVVTHSLEIQVSAIRKQNPILDTIPFWITREHYNNPKPSSECYEKAISLLANEGDKIVGFEDSPRGLQALLGTRGEAVMISSFFNEEEVGLIAKDFGKPFGYSRSFVEFCKKRSG